MPRRSPLITLFVLVASLVGSTYAGPASRPATLPSTRPATARADIDKAVLPLTRKSIELMEKGKLDEAEPVLLKALALDPTHTTNLYNYACLLALKGKPDLAIAHLERAAEYGWTDFVHVGRDPDLNSIRDLPRYKQFVARKDAYQAKAAERAVASLKRQFGEGYLYEIDLERKLIFATNTDAATLADLKKWLTAQANSQWQQLFATKPDDFIGIVLPSPADYRKIVRIPGVGGFYNDAAKVLVAQRLGQTVTHEFTHALHAADRAPLGQDHPIWIAEGLASMFEAAQFEGDKLVPHDNFRLNVLQKAAAARQLITLDNLIKMQQPGFVARANLAYGEASSVMLYLYETDKLKPFYEAYKKGYDEDATGQRAIEKVTGRTFPEFEKDWTAWMVRRPPVPQSTGTDGVVLGARLGDANDGLKIESILPGGPAAKAGLRAGDTLVGIGDAQVRDSLSFVPLMIQLKPGDRVTAKIRRDGKYLELPITLGRRSEVIEGAVNQPRLRKDVPSE
jgi:tetratricopeptide (TPR) repeat protein